MGFATSVALSRAGYRVVMLCRNAERGGAALAAAKAAAGDASGRIELEVCDLASLASVRSCAERLRGKFDGLDALVNNAGLISPRRKETADGFELQFGVNHLGHFLLTVLVLDLVKKARGRIVVVSSGAHKVGRIHWDDLRLVKWYSAFGAYGQSKLANILFTRELARRLEGTGATANCLNPGAVGTNMGVDRETGFGGTVMGLLKPFFQTPEAGADTAIYLATSPEVADVSGEYFYRRKSAKTSARARDDAAAARLWEASVALTGAPETAVPA
jgi:NAD(P)-dependent dehydrogenase (short-subunit alcohol dehydrogenase family)